ncbi:MAG: hypothetical protein MRY59_07605 [Aquisalinus sp.]|nr:hypothetical protein [Aquisalinus sp.]
MKRFTKTVLAGLGISLLAACATETPYAPRGEGSGYGYSEQSIESNRYRVTFRGNSTTSRETVENYLLYRSAELTIQKGFDYFVVVEDETERTTRYSGTTYPGLAYYGRGRPFPYYGYGYPWGGFNDFDIRESNRYTAIAYILMYKGQKPRQANAYTAREVVDNLSRFVVRPE